MSYAEYRDAGGVDLVACRGAEEDVEDYTDSNETWGEDIDEVNADVEESDEVIFRDDRTGKPLVTEKVIAARTEELKELDKRVWKEADVKECWDRKGRGPIGVRWVDVDEGFGVHRSRLVAKDFKPRSKIGDKEGLFAATPPLELVKTLIVKAAKCRRRGEDARKVMFLDISKAHLYAPIQDEEYVEYPPEKRKEGKCAKLIFTLYGMRTAAGNWEKEYSTTLTEAGFSAGKATVVAFYHKQRDVRIVVHGDDFVVEGTHANLNWVETILAAKYITKVRGILGPQPGDQKSIDILGRVIEWRPNELWWEADPRHVEKIIDEMGLKDGNGTAAPGLKDQEQEGDETQLAGDDLRRYRSVVARANFISQDRPDIRYTVKELCRSMSKPTMGSFRRLKRLARYLKSHPRMVQKIKFGKELEEDGVRVMVDSDFAGCVETRKSTNGGCILVGDVCVKSWSSTQSVVALSSGEAEYYSAIKGASEGLGFIAACADLCIWGDEVGKLQVLTDSSASKGICQRTGLGKVRHIDVAYLWLQDVVRRGRVAMKKIPGTANLADLLTKYLSGTKTLEITSLLGFYSEDGRSDLVDRL